jgi:malate/lactate dehydrogenase
VYLSLPAIVNKTGIRQVLNIELDQKEQSAFKDSAAALKKVIQEVGL